MGQRISGQHQGQRILFSAKEGRRHDRTHDQRNAEITLDQRAPSRHDDACVAAAWLRCVAVYQFLSGKRAPLKNQRNLLNYQNLSGK
jgi:hypothetical protein